MKNLKTINFESVEKMMNEWGLVLKLKQVETKKNLNGVAY